MYKHAVYVNTSGSYGCVDSQKEKRELDKRFLISYLNTHTMPKESRSKLQRILGRISIKGGKSLYWVGRYHSYILDLKR